MPRNPDTKRDSYSGDDANPIRRATPEELAARSAAASVVISTRDLIESLTDEEFAAMQQAKPRNTAAILAGPTTDVTSDLRDVADDVWPDPAVKARRLGELRAVQPRGK